MLLVDNGSLEPAATLNLRRIAAALAAAAGRPVEPISWKHSDRIPAERLAGRAAVTLGAFIREQFARGQRAFHLLPFFISPQGAIGSALRRDLEQLQAELGPFTFTFGPGLAELGVIARIVAARVRETALAAGLVSPPVVLVDHGGPSPASAALRDQLGREVADGLTPDFPPPVVASMEGDHPPLLAEVLAQPAHAGRDVIVALLFLSPGRHAGPGGDIAEICAASPARTHCTGLIGTHPLALAALAATLPPPAASSLFSHRT
ncbi:MAG: sirohydrochlorin chelatase [Opitutaceae bacterium]